MMKRWILIFAAAFLVLGGIYLLRTNGKRHSDFSTLSVTSDIGSSSPPQRAITGTSAPRGSITGSLSGNNVRIDFWGKVVDQEGRPLSGATVNVSIREWVLPSPLYPAAKNSRSSVATGADGVFSIHNALGDVLGVDEIIKPGYVLSPKATREFNFKRGGPVNPTNPVVFKMWKQRPKQSLREGLKFVQLVPDNRWYTIDLLEGTTPEGEHSGGDLQVRINRPSEVEPRNKYAWSYELKVPDGGIVESDDEFMFLAPEAGYQPTYARRFNPEESGWTYLVRERRFFILTRGKIYGRLSIDIYADFAKNAAVSIKYALNPTGSRGLE